MTAREREPGRSKDGQRTSDAAPRRSDLAQAPAPANRTHVVPTAPRAVRRRRSIKTKVVGLGVAGSLYGGGVAAASMVSPLASAITAAAGAATLVATSVALSNSITVPIRDVGRHMRRFSDGDLAVRADTADDEIGTLARSFNEVANSLALRLTDLEDNARRAAQLRAITEALEMSADEAQVYRILERSIGVVAPSTPAELLIADHGGRLQRVAGNPVAGPAGCPVSSVESCVAMRRAQTMTFESPSTINSCPMLAEHESPCSAVCVPVGVQGHLLGVMHVTAREGDPPHSSAVEQLVSISGLVGTRIGAIRALENSRLEASTDGLTGLANRRKLEAAVEDLLNESVPFSLVLADIDHFKALNDNYGHEVGDRALQLFASVLQDNVRGHDVVARFGGEEFVLVYPRLPAPRAIEVLDRIRFALTTATEAAGLPSFTTSFGVASSSVADSFDDIVRVADAGLFAAKQAGRNRVVFADQALAERIFAGGMSTARSDGNETLIDLTEPAASRSDGRS